MTLGDAAIRLPLMRLPLASIAVAASMAAATATAAGDVTVASGVYRHASWALVASDGPSGSYCITMQQPRGRLDGSGCGSIFGGRAHGVSYLAHNGTPAPDYVVGPVVSKARRVLVTFTDGSHVTLRTIPPPAGLARNIRFYVQLMPCRSTQPKRIVGTDSGGRVVAFRLPALSLPRPHC